MWENKQNPSTVVFVPPLHSRRSQERGGEKSSYFTAAASDIIKLFSSLPPISISISRRGIPHTHKKLPSGETESIMRETVFPRRTNSGPDLLKEALLLLLSILPPLWGFLSVCPEGRREEGIWILGLDRQFSTTPPTPEEEGGKLFFRFWLRKSPISAEEEATKRLPSPPEQPTQKKSFFLAGPTFLPSVFFLLLLKYTPSPLFLPSIPPHPFSRICSRIKNFVPPHERDAIFGLRGLKQKCLASTF